jgi:hypothetical protein
MNQTLKLRTDCINDFRPAGQCPAGEVQSFQQRNSGFEAGRTIDIACEPFSWPRFGSR